MADAAFNQVISALQARLQTIPGVNIFVDRDDSEPIQPEERPAIVIRAMEDTLDERMGETGKTLQTHTITIDLDFYVDADVLDNITFQHNRMIASAIAVLHTDWTLGNLVYEFTPMSVTASADAVPSAGVAILTLSASFQTEFGDWTQIVF